MGSKFLDNFPEIVDKMLKLFPKDTTFYATDREVFIFKDNAVDVPLAQVGKKFLRNGPAWRCIQSGEVQSMEIDETYYGVPLKVMCAPVFDDDDPENIIGVYGVAILRDNAFSLRRLCNTYQKEINEIKKSAERIEDAASMVNFSEVKINTELAGVNEIIREIETSVGYVSDFAERVKKIGPDAAGKKTEAGKTGEGLEEACRQAQELFLEVEKNNNKIKEFIAKIREKVEKIMQNSDVALRESEEQAAAIRKIIKSIEEMSDNIGELNRIAHEI